jgi:hypothetical protein
MELVFRWSEIKARTNLAKHKVSFEEAKTVFNDPFVITFSDERHSDDEERHISIGNSINNRLLLVVHIEQERLDGKFLIRVISCRKATTMERKDYESRID